MDTLQIRNCSAEKQIEIMEILKREGFSFKENKKSYSYTPQRKVRSITTTNEVEVKLTLLLALEAINEGVIAPSIAMGFIVNYGSEISLNFIKEKSMTASLTTWIDSKIYKVVETEEEYWD